VCHFVVSPFVSLISTGITGRRPEGRFDLLYIPVQTAGNHIVVIAILHKIGFFAASWAFLELVEIGFVARSAVRTAIILANVNEVS
jgi:hypothetical protein